MTDSAEAGTVARRAGIVAIFTLLSRILGYVRDAFLAYTFGASAVYDAFVVAQTIPNFLRRLFAEGSLVIALVPLVAEVEVGQGKPAARRFVAAVLGALIPILAVLVALGMFFPGVVVEAFAPGFDPLRRGLAETLTVVMMPFILFVSLAAVAGGVLNHTGRFASSAAAPILLNVSILAAAVLLADRFEEPIVAVALGVTAGGLLQLLLQVPFLRRAGFLVLPRLVLGHPELRLLLRRMGPALFGVAIYQINLMLIRQIGSYLPEGQLSCYYNATRLQEFALGVFAVSVSVAALPTLSAHAAERRFDKLGETARRALLGTNFVTIPASLGLVLLADPIVGVLFRHGRFTAEDAALTADLLRVLGVVIVPIGVARVLVPVFYALGDTKTPVVAGAVSLASLFLVGHALRDAYQIVGLTLAIGASTLAQVAVLRLSLGRALRSRGAAFPPGAVRHGLRAALAFVPGGLALYAGLGITPWFTGDLLPRLLGLGALVAVGSGSYFGVGYLLKIDEVEMLVSAVRRRLARRL